MALNDTLRDLDEAGLFYVATNSVKNVQNAKSDGVVYAAVGANGDDMVFYGADTLDDALKAALKARRDGHAETHSTLMKF